MEAPESCLQKCQWFMCHTARWVSTLAMLVTFWCIPYIEYKVKDNTIDMQQRHRASIMVSQLPTHNMFAWTNLNVEDSRHDNVLDTHSYDTFTIFAPVAFNLVLAVYWFLRRVLVDNRDAILGVFGVAIITDTLCRCLQSNVGIMGLKQEEPMLFSVILGFVVLDTGPTQVCVRMAWTLFLTRDFIISKLGVRANQLFGPPLHSAMAGFLWAYTNYTHQLEPISIVTSISMCYWFVHLFNVFSDQETVMYERQAIEAMQSKHEQLAQMLYRNVKDVMTKDRAQIQNERMSAGMEHVPPRMLVSNPTGNAETGIGYHATGSDLVVEFSATEDEADDSREKHLTGQGRRAYVMHSNASGNGYVAPSGPESEDSFADSAGDEAGQATSEEDQELLKMMTSSSSAAAVTIGTGTSPQKVRRERASRARKSETVQSHPVPKKPDSSHPVSETQHKSQASLHDPSESHSTLQRNLHSSVDDDDDQAESGTLLSDPYPVEDP
jgi:hypothetical protein